MVTKISIATISENLFLARNIVIPKLVFLRLLTVEISITCLIAMVTKVSLATTKGTNCTLGEDAFPVKF